MTPARSTRKPCISHTSAILGEGVGAPSVPFRNPASPYAPNLLPTCAATAPSCAAAAMVGESSHTGTLGAESLLHPEWQETLRAGSVSNRVSGPGLGNLPRPAGSSSLHGNRNRTRPPAEMHGWTGKADRV